jgi:hypothetical protein
MADQSVTTVQRRPEYIELREKALLDAIFGNYDAGSGFSGGLIQDPELFKIAPYALASQIGRDEAGNITGFGLETFASQALSQDLDGDGTPDFLQRYSPYFDAARQSTGAAGETLGMGLGQLGQTGEYFQPATEYIQAGRGMYDPSQYVEQFMSPYTANVLQQVEKDIERQGDVARQKSAASAVGAGAFGGSRQGIQAAEVERSILDAKAKAAADLQARNYEQALTASQNAYQQGQLRNLEAGRLMGGLGQSVGQVGSQIGQIGSAYGQLGGTTADIGRVYSALGPADLAYMTGVGEAERDYRQKMIDTARMEYQRPTEQALLPYNYAYGALTGSPSANIYSSTQNTYTPATNPFVAGLGAYTALQGINQSS